MNWLVIYRTEWTQSQRGEPLRFATKELAEAWAADFNRFSQDTTWNAVRAYVHHANEKVRA